MHTFLDKLWSVHLASEAECVRENTEGQQVFTAVFMVFLWRSYQNGNPQKYSGSLGSGQVVGWDTRLEKESIPRSSRCNRPPLPTAISNCRAVHVCATNHSLARALSPVERINSLLPIEFYGVFNGFGRGGHVKVLHEHKSRVTGETKKKYSKTLALFCWHACMPA